MDFSSDELIRYQRHFTLKEIGETGQKKLKKLTVLCVGAGGLGSPALMYLSAAGVGTLGIVDDDIVELSNLQRQLLYDSSNINQKKVHVTKEKLLTINPNIEVITHDTYLNHANAFQILESYDIIVDGTDNYQTRYLINDVCNYLKKPCVFSSVLRFEGQIFVFVPNLGPCYRCLYPNPPKSGLIPNCAEGGVLGILPGIFGTIQATEVIKLALKIGKSLCGRLLTLDALTMQWQEYSIPINKDCLLCVKKESFGNLPRYNETCNHEAIFTQMTPTELSVSLDNFSDHNLSLIDVRESYERKIVNIGGQHIPLNDLVHHITKFRKKDRIIIYCKSGERSQRAVKLFNKAGFKNVHSLKGGILAWVKEINPKLPSY